MRAALLIAVVLWAAVVIGVDRLVACRVIVMPGPHGETFGAIR